MTVQADEADVIGELVIYFVGFVIVLGAVVTYAQYLVPTRLAFFKEMPYVVVIFILGFVTNYLHECAFVDGTNGWSHCFAKKAIIRCANAKYDGRKHWNSKVSEHF